MAVWEWHAHKDQWKEYTPAVSAQLEAAFSSPNAPPVHLPRTVYEVHLDSMLQRNLTTGFERRVRRATADTEDEWMWEGDHKWESFDRISSAQLSAAMRARRQSTVLYVGRLSATYAVDLRQMVQTNAITGTARATICIAAPSASAAASTSSLPLPASAAVARPSPASAVVGSSSGGGAASRRVGAGSRQRPQWVLAAADGQLLAEEHFRAQREVDIARVTRWMVLAPGAWPADGADPITLDTLGEEGEQVVRLPCDASRSDCIFNRSTVERTLPQTGRCPLCSYAYSVRGPQPSGTMRLSFDHRSCSGHEGQGSIQVAFSFSSGTQGPQHPSPGRRYRGTSRVCVYPCDAVGVGAVLLLRVAFGCGLLFRVGTSVTTGEEDVVVWSVHQKTRHHGGEAAHGWPDAGFLERLKAELAGQSMSVDEMLRIEAVATEAVAAGGKAVETALVRGV